MKCCQLIQQRLLAVECRVFGDNCTAEFGKICRGKWGPCLLSHTITKQCSTYFNNILLSFSVLTLQAV